MLVGKDWKIETDALNVILYRRKEREEKDTGARYEAWETVGYFATVKAALHEMINRGIRDADLVDVRVLDAKIDVLHLDVEHLSGVLQQATRRSKSEKGIQVPVGVGES